MYITELLLLIILTATAVRFIAFTVTRVRLFTSVRALSRISGVDVTVTNAAAFFLPFITKGEAARVTVRGKIYRIFIFNGISERFCAHIASPRYATVFLKSGGVAKARRTEDGARYRIEGSRVYIPRTVLLPEGTDDAPGTERVLLFSPCPSELTYVTEKRTSIRLAFVGDKAFGYRIFTRRSFERYIDRDARGFFD